MKKEESVDPEACFLWPQVKKNLALRSRVGFIENTGHGGDVAQLTECLPSMHTAMGLIHSTTESEPGVTHL